MNSKDKKFFEAVIERCTDKIAGADRKIAKFAAEIIENPSHAFQWADGAMITAAEHKVAHVLKSMTEAYMAQEREAKELRAEVQSIILREAKYMKRSTSMSSNFVDNAITAAWADSLDSFGGLLGRLL